MADEARESDRVQETREEEERPRDWQPPEKLAAPTPPEGISLRFVRYRVRNEDDAENVVERRRQGYEFVTPEEIKSWGSGEFLYAHMEDASDKGRSGEVRVGDLVLMKIPTYMAKQRTDYYAHTTKALAEAIDAELRSQGTAMAPIPANESRSSVSFGTGASPQGRPVQFQD